MGDGLESLFWIMAIAGSGLFILKTALLLMGADDGDAGDHGGEDAAGDTSSAQASYLAFKLLSIQALATFSMGAGWMGLAALQNFGFAEAQAVFVALAAGLGLVILMGRLLQYAKKLESSGNLKLRSAVGTVGTVYSSIPAKGRGQVQVVLQGKLVTLDASTHGAALATGTRIKVDDVQGGALLIVSAA